MTSAVTTPRGVLSLRAGFTRSADTTAYAVNDLVGVNTSVAAGNTIEVPNAVASPGDAVRIERIVLRKSNKSLTNAQFRVHIFDRQPTWDVGDNGAGGTISALAVADLAGHCGYVDITMDRASATAGAYGEAAPATPITVSPLTGTSIYYAVQALAAYTPVSQETFQAELAGIRP